MCDCSCFSFVGIPCKYIIELLFKRHFGPGHLDFSCKWKKNYNPRSNSASDTTTNKRSNSSNGYLFKYLQILDVIISNPKYSVSKGHPKGSTRLKSFLERITPQKPQVVLIRIPTKYNHIEEICSEKKV